MKWRTTTTPSWNSTRRWPRITRRCTRSWHPVRQTTCCMAGTLFRKMLGPDRVRDYVCPCWNAFADRLHERGKKIGVHLDANNRLILDVVRNSKLDFVEAFTPPPDCNVSVAEARAAWPGKRLWTNFPSSLHIQSEDTIREATLEITAAGRRPQRLPHGGDRRHSQGTHCEKRDGDTRYPKECGG